MAMTQQHHQASNHQGIFHAPFRGEELDVPGSRLLLDCTGVLLMLLALVFFFQHGPGAFWLW